MRRPHMFTSLLSINPPSSSEINSSKPQLIALVHCHSSGSSVWLFWGPRCAAWIMMLLWQPQPQLRRSSTDTVAQAALGSRSCPTCQCLRTPSVLDTNRVITSSLLWEVVIEARTQLRHLVAPRLLLYLPKFCFRTDTSQGWKAKGKADCCLEIDILHSLSK